MAKPRHPILTATLLLLVALAPLASGADPDAARTAVADVLFDMDIENASFKVRGDGYVDILFGPSLPDAQYRAALTRLKAHPDIPGVLAGRGAGDFCPTPGN